MAYPEEFFRQQSVADTLAVLDKGLERAAQLKEGKSPWTTQKGGVVRGFRSALMVPCNLFASPFLTGKMARERFRWM